MNFFFSPFISVKKLPFSSFLSMKSIDGHLSLLLSDWSDCYFLESQGFLCLNWYVGWAM